MNRFSVGFLATLVAVCLLRAETKSVSTPATAALAASTRADTVDPVEREYVQLLEADDAAQDEVDRWIRDDQAYAEKGARGPDITLNARIEERFDKVKRAYTSFLERHPNHARARLAFGSFLYEIHEEEQAVTAWEKSREQDPNNPAAWNNLANHYGHRGPVRKAFEYYAKAIALNTNEPVYLQNLATTTYLFRTDAMEYYQLSEPQVFDRALDLYARALKLDPKNFPLAHDLAQSYYGIRPQRTDDALAAWNHALKLANDDVEREGVYLHMARVEITAGRFQAARRHVNLVTNAMYTALKERIVRNLNDKEMKAGGLRSSTDLSREPGPVLPAFSLESDTGRAPKK